MLVCLGGRVGGAGVGTSKIKKATHEENMRDRRAIVVTIMTYIVIGSRERGDALPGRRDLKRLP